ncbi:MAG: PQQ-binding-like beta-propeller repeat protein [Caldisericales bacterium]|nr:PQQ-binding-like beta-propeller repeat protein [bacterium]
MKGKTEDMTTRTFGAVSTLAFLLLASCGPSPAKPASATAKFVEGASAGYHSTGKATLFGDSLIVPVEGSVVSLSLPGLEPEWKYDAPTDKGWQCVYAGSAGGNIVCVFQSMAGDLTVHLDGRGRETWKNQNEKMGSLPRTYSEKIYRVEGESVFIGEKKFAVPLSLPIIEANGGSIYTVTVEGEVQARNESGDLLWGAKLISRTNSLKAFSWGVVALCENETIALDQATGSVLWSRSIRATCQPVELGGKLVIAYDKGLMALDRKGDIVYAVDLECQPIFVSAATDGIEVICSGKLIAMDLKLTKISEFVAPNGANQVEFFPGGMVVSGYSQKVFVAD